MQGLGETIGSVVNVGFGNCKVCTTLPEELYMNTVAGSSNCVVELQSRKSLSVILYWLPLR